ncbi:MULTISPECIES: hypothetical protein [Paenibacillus]|uniref:RiboL-PSP-HEPN domain-containing protein n=1 Tax=Paenibacillus borealis TaxID=160799 RepID=A0ABX3H081_PAEBO|nr:hypothetical protein [Paenibacillus borealis]OMD42000.1 hypothetical protein BSK56_26375 [Paenibacillus borealis]
MHQTDPRNIITYASGEAYGEPFQAFIRGQLYIETLLSEIIVRSFKNPEALKNITNSFHNKVKIVRGVDRISAPMEDLLLQINSVRNKLAHKLEFNLVFNDAFELVEKAAEAKVDFSDENIYLDRNYSELNYGVTGVVAELMSNTFSQILFENEDMFTHEDIGRFLG